MHSGHPETRCAGTVHQVASLDNGPLLNNITTMVLSRSALLCACLAALLCPAMCFGGWFQHDADAELPGQHSGQQPCAEHACFCNGAPVSPEKPGQRQVSRVSDLTVAAVFLPALSSDMGTGLLGHPDATPVVSAPPTFDRILPLLL